MSIDISPADTGEIARAVGEDTRVLNLNDSPIRPRRPWVTGEFQIVIPATIGIVDGPTVDLGGEGGSAVAPPAYVGRHREKPEPAPVPAWRSPEALASVVLPGPAVEDSRGPNARETFGARLRRWIGGAR